MCAKKSVVKSSLLSALLAALLMTVGYAHAEFSVKELQVFDNEPPVIKDLLIGADVLEGKDDDLDSK